MVNSVAIFKYWFNQVFFPAGLCRVGVFRRQIVPFFKVHVQTSEAFEKKTPEYFAFEISSDLYGNQRILLFAWYSWIGALTMVKEAGLDRSDLIMAREGSTCYVEIVNLYV